MSDTVDLMVVSIAEEMSAEELSRRLVAEFKQPADAFDALVTAATGAGPAYAAQSNVALDVAMEGKRKLESLGVICSIPGVTDQHSANAENIELAEDDSSVDVGNSDDVVDLTALTDAEFDTSDDEADFLSSVDGASDDSEQQLDQQKPEEGIDNSAADALADESSFDFADELEALGTAIELSDTPVAEVDSSESTADELAFEIPVEDLQSLAEDTAEFQVVEDVSVQDDVVDDEIVADDGDTDSAELDFSDMAISDDDDTPLTKRKESSNVELDDGGLSLASGDSVAPIKASATDVPEALANRKPADAMEELSLSLDDTAASPVKNSNRVAEGSLSELETSLSQNDKLEQRDADLEVHTGIERDAEVQVDVDAIGANEPGDDCQREIRIRLNRSLHPIRK